ncbi:tyrosine-type recombinase/integrase [Mycoplasmopsis lipofaciens]|uniref:tyrosine-type recombinase/integrase n=1 Tax=Mycoplasmopsis lipofaciens TaxID=114884 RepID=UPI00048930D7|nr:tyrosine-type recombinase/integrase [Mycoplasmopsis lipofaciens]
MSIKKDIQMFLNQNYKNEQTRRNASMALRRIEHLNKIDVSEINEIYKNIPMNALSGSSRNTELAYIRKFIKVMSEINNSYYNVHQLIDFENDSKPKKVFTEEEMEMILKELKNFNHSTFEMVFKLLLYNGCRLGEFVKVPWNKMINMNYEFQLKASKHGRFRTITVPYELQKDFNEFGVDLSYNTIQNLFNKFNKFVKQNNPDFNKNITAHVLRAQLITNMHLRGIGIDEIQCVTGHMNQSTITTHYIKTNATYHKQLLKMANMKAFDSMELNKVKSHAQIQEKQISYLELQNEEQKEIIKKLKTKISKLEGKELYEEQSSENADMKRTKNEYKTNTDKNFSNFIFSLKSKISKTIFNKIENMNEKK